MRRYRSHNPTAIANRRREYPDQTITTAEVPSVLDALLARAAAPRRPTSAASPFQT
jgi:hypothetical protein